MFKRLALITLMLIANNINCADNCVDQETEINQALGLYFQELMNQDDNMVEMIKINFNVSSPVMIDFLITQIDPINLAIDLFKQNFTLEEIQVILAFHTSDIGRKFAELFPAIIQAYDDALNQKIEDYKLAIATVIAESNTL